MTEEEPNKKRKTKDEERPRCQFFLANKRRNCAMTRKVDQKYCAEHMSLEDANNQRIPCPLDNSHFVWKHKLAKHIKKCKVQKTEVNLDPWFVHNINGKVESQKERSFDESEFSQFLQEFLSSYDKMQYPELETKEYADSSIMVQQRLDLLTNKKHIIQQSSLIQHLEKNKLLGPNYRYMEFGCGRAELSRYIGQSVFDKDKSYPSFTLIDRTRPRLKMDSKIQKDFKELTKNEYNAVSCQRIKIDIKDLALNRLDSVNDPFIVVSKHLCGVATDLTLQCLENYEKTVSDSKLAGCLIAMCCRHCCHYDNLLPGSKKFLISKFGISERQFYFLTKICSWATNGKRPEISDQDGKDHFSGYCLAERKIIGLKARRVIDESRRASVTNYTTHLFHYVSEETSLENTCLLLLKKS
ncbi:BA75_02645T0 [Komagataella pastoris]|uniref:tRNA:m(4)X modification enzyme TRM13 n=1 Tax=Komagataella pastoris TaxID=4922 RepID=A0A1B2JAG3_PICPA|nr:BA75_02645T0 [Komagataella pastoris]